MINSIIKIAGNDRPEKIISFALWVLLLTALIGCILSGFGICNGACTDAANYRLFGLRFASVGVPFFVFAILASCFRNRHEQRQLQSLCPSTTRRSYHRIFDFMLAGAVGAEYLFLYIQKNLIGHYCPICVVIAAAVGAATIIRVGEVVMQKSKSPLRSVGKRSVLIALYVVFMLVVGYSGLTLAIAGTSNNAESGNSSTSQTRALSEKIWLTTPVKASDVEVYFVTDWFCDFCRKSEPVIENMLPAVSKVARFTFLDDPIHKESKNFIPFNVSLLLNDKTRYSEGRKALLELAGKTKVPSYEMVKTAFEQKGITLHLANYSDVVDLSDSTAAFLKRNKVTMTPSVVVANRTNGESRVLSGIENITEGMVLMTIKRLQEHGR